MTPQWQPALRAKLLAAVHRTGQPICQGRLPSRCTCNTDAQAAQGRDPLPASCVQNCSSSWIPGLCILPNISEAAPSFITAWTKTSTLAGVPATAHPLRPPRPVCVPLHSTLLLPWVLGSQAPLLTAPLHAFHNHSTVQCQCQL